MTRFSDWRSRLNDYLAQSATKGFRPGSHDCAMFAAGGVEAMTGVDPAAKYRGCYRTLEKAYADLNEDGFFDHVDFAASLFKEIPVAQAGVGDLAAVKGDGVWCLGIVTGPSIAVLKLDGMGFVKLTDAQRAFAV